MKNVLGILLVLVAIVAVAYGSWRLERWWHYKFSYQAQVQLDMQPLVQRVADLERRVSVLETNKNNNNK